MSLKVLFSGSRFIFWALAPLLILCAVVLSLNTNPSSPLHVAVLILADAFILLLVIGLYNPRRNHWALRCVTGVVFVAYLGYWIDELRVGKLFPSTDRGVESILAGRRFCGLFGLLDRRTPGRETVSLHGSRCRIDPRRDARLSDYWLAVPEIHVKGLCRHRSIAGRRRRSSRSRTLNNRSQTRASVGDPRWVTITL